MICLLISDPVTAPALVLFRPAMVLFPLIISRIFEILSRHLSHYCTTLDPGRPGGFRERPSPKKNLGTVEGSGVESNTTTCTWRRGTCDGDPDPPHGLVSNLLRNHNSDRQRVMGSVECSGNEGAFPYA